MNDFPDTLYASDRHAAKGHADYPLTQEYIERLERIALASGEYWKNSGRQNDLQISYGNALYDALDAVNFLDESL